MATKKFCWLIKSEPSVYSFAQLQKEKRTAWTGIRNFQARNNLRQMKPGDLCFYYHTGDEKAVVGVAKVLTAPAPDPTAEDGDWSSVDVAPVKAFAEPVSLSAIKANKALRDFQLVTHSRLSVIPVSPAHLKVIAAMGKTKL